MGDPTPYFAGLTRLNGAFDYLIHLSPMGRGRFEQQLDRGFVIPISVPHRRPQARARGGG